MSKKSKYATQVTAEAKSGVAFIRIVDVISDYGETSSHNIRLMIDGFLKDGIKIAEVYVNSRGGNCFESVEIGNELERLDDVELSVGALAASAATYLVAKFKTKARPNSQFMIHRPRLGTYGDIVTITSDLKLLENTTGDYKTVYALKTGKTEEEIEEMWSKGDVWLTANEALAMGLINSIQDQGDLAVTAQDVALLEACGAPNIPQPISENQNVKIKMDRNLLISALGLGADATDEQILEATKSAKTKADLQVTAEASAEDLKKSAAKTLVDGALESKKITATTHGFWLKSALANLAETTATLSQMPSVPKLSAVIEGGGDPFQMDAARSNWTYADWQEKDSKGLEAMAENHPSEFNELFKKQK